MQFPVRGCCYACTQYGRSTISNIAPKVCDAISGPIAEIKLCEGITPASADIARGESKAYSKLKMSYAQLRFQALFSRGVKFKCGLETYTTRAGRITMLEKHHIHTLHITSRLQSCNII